MLTLLLQSVGKAVREQHWEVTEETWLSTFSFESLVIYGDLRALVDAAVANPVVAALSRAIESKGKSEALPHELDSLPTPGTVPIPVLPTDSSQLESLTLSSLGHHVVVHGPPGTGKSQTITNLVADALARNKKVLFVSTKMAALNVVYDRLKQLGLQRFCVEAHIPKHCVGQGPFLCDTAVAQQPEGEATRCPPGHDSTTLILREDDGSLGCRVTP